MSKLYVVTDIQWDVDEMEDIECLPSMARISSDDLLRNGEDAEDKELVAERVSDYLSDHYGFCHKGFAIEECN